MPKTFPNVIASTDCNGLAKKIRDRHMIVQKKLMMDNQPQHTDIANRFLDFFLYTNAKYKYIDTRINDFSMKICNYLLLS